MSSYSRKSFPLLKSTLSSPGALSKHGKSPGKGAPWCPQLPSSLRIPSQAPFQGGSLSTGINDQGLLYNCLSTKRLCLTGVSSYLHFTEHPWEEHSISSSCFQILKNVHCIIYWKDVPAKKKRKKLGSVDRMC